MKFRWKKFSKCSAIFYLLLFFVVLLFCIKFNSLIVSRFLYWINGIFERFLYSTDNRNAVFQLSSKNHYCIKPLMNFKDETSIYYLNKDRDLLEPIFKECGDNTNFAESLTYIKLKNNSSTAYITRLIINKTYLTHELSLPKHGLACYSQRFDKKMNVSEENQEVYHFETEKFEEKNFTYEQSIQQPGFYYVFCEKNLFRNQIKIYENVISVLDENLKSFSEKRLNFKKIVENFKISLNISNHHLLSHNDDKFKQCSNKDANSEERFNVLILGIDSVSYNHFKRIFPLTFSFLNNELDDNIIFEQLNSVGGNTYPNILATLCGVIEENLTGLNYSSEINFYRDIDSTFHDHFPFIWNDYENLGYVTMYQEDDPSIAIFNYYKNGFRYPPTTYYGRPFWTKYYKIRNGPEKCHYKKPTYQLWIEQIELFLKQMNRSKKVPYFSFNFLSEMTHGQLAIPKNLDFQLRNFLKQMNSNGHLDNTMLLLLSDHGNRLNYFSYGTEAGKLEKFLPFISIKLPRKMIHTKLFSNLKGNKNKLISFFDIYQTLKHFYYINKYGLETFEKSNPCREIFQKNDIKERYQRGISLFVSFTIFTIY
jgi:hypothetical protein